MSSSEAMPEKVRVLVVDDSTFMRRMISDMIARFTGYEVIGVAGDGREALTAIERLDPDLVTLDIEMPRLDGFGVLEHTMKTDPRPIVVLSAYTGEGTRSALRALELGAVDLVAKPSGPISFDMARVEARLFEALEAARVADVDVLTRGRPAMPVESLTRPGGESGIVAIAASTGGPTALSFILRSMPADLGASILVVQHMPAGFTSTLAGRLDEISPLSVREATGGESVLEGGKVWLAPGDFHMRVRRDHDDVKIVLDQRDPIWGTRPAADALFPSVASVFGGRVVGCVLTGMGRDGASGLEAIQVAGGRTLAQDRDSSVVYGMPARALESGAAERSLSLDELPGAIVECLRGFARTDARQRA